MKYIFIYIFFFLSCASTDLYIKNSYDIIYTQYITQYELAFITRTVPQENLIFIDLRPTIMFQKKHLPNAISLPYKELKNITNITNIQQKKIIFYDQEQVELSKIKKILAKYDITNYQTLQYGFNGWNTNQNSI